MNSSIVEEEQPSCFQPATVLDPVAERTDELLKANAGLEKQIREIAQAKRRLAAEHAVARILARTDSRHLRV